jgi:thiamine kinase-like enzyme
VMAVCATTLSQSAAANDAARSFPRLFVQVDAEDKGAMCSSVKDTISQVVGCSSAVLAVEPVTGGLSNYLFKVVDTQQTPSLPKPLLVRVFGPLAMDRERENRIFAVLAKEGIGPSLLATFGNGRVEEFLDEYHTLEPSEFLGERHGQAVAERLATLHSVEVARAAELSMGSESAIWGQLERWLEDASAADFSARPQHQQARVQKILEALKADVHKWKQTFSSPCWTLQGPSDSFWAQLRLCHNDLHGVYVFVHAHAYVYRGEWSVRAS